MFSSAYRHSEAQKKSKKNGETPLHVLASVFARNKDHLELANWLVQQDRTLLQKTTIDGEKALHSSAKFADIELAKWLVQQDHSLVQKKTKKGKTALDIAKGSSMGTKKIAEWLETII